MYSLKFEMGYDNDQIVNTDLFDKESSPFPGFKTLHCG